jgi:iron(III) transport system substrate-binding protein
MGMFVFKKVPMALTVAPVLLLTWTTFAAPVQSTKDWETEWEKVVAAAKKEGELRGYFQGATSYLQDFKKKYPEIKVLEYGVGGGSVVGPRVITERRAGKYLVDLHVGGPDTAFSTFHRAKVLDVLRSVLLLPEVLDQSRWFERRHHYLDADRQFIFIFEGTPQSYLSYNVNLVRLDEIPSYWNLLNPKWKGKIIAQDPMITGVVSHGIRFMYYNPELGPRFMARLFGEMDITISRDWRQMVNWLASGKFLLCLFCYGVEDAKKQGIPVDLIGPYHLKEGANIVPVLGTTSLMSNAPHPNAAKVFINWLLSREGQIAYHKSRLLGLSPADSLRTDIPKDELPPEGRRTEGKHLLTSRAEWMDLTPIRDVIKDVYGK